MGEQQRIALYGGTFDPVHFGHLAVARNVTALFGLTEVLFIPAHIAPHKRERAVTPPVQRYAMLALATQSEPRFRISTVELDAPERPYTVNTLARFVETLGRAARLFFVMGADSWLEITTWREWERVLSLANHIVVTRPGYELNSSHVTNAVRDAVVDLRGANNEWVARVLDENLERTRIYLTDAATVDVSATAIRNATQAGKDAADLASLVPSPVADYIKKYRLYRETHETEFFDTGTTH
ncbi:MAG TPA: nicotinate-nucleotide adenylyltransferase [Pyrinomonadaceae bacterium]|jgi:nicotinate-nucleotide adenylyltransferase